MEYEEVEPKCIVCYGDSNTYGVNGDGGRRIPYTFRWTTVLERKLTERGFHAKVIAEGLSGRTTVMDDEHCWQACDGAPHGMNGRSFLLPCLNSHKTVDVLVLALGTNDLKRHFSLSPQQIAVGVSLLLHDIKRSTIGVSDGPPKYVFVLPPPPLDDQKIKTAGHEDFLPNAAVRAMEVGYCLLQMVEDNFEAFQKAGMTVKYICAGVATGKDGVHYNSVGSQEMGVIMATAIGDIL